MSKIFEKERVMKAFRVEGTFLMGNEKQRFVKEVASKNENHAKELVYSDLGSKHRTKRKDITIDNIVEISTEDITNPIIKYKVTPQNI